MAPPKKTAAKKSVPAAKKTAAKKPAPYTAAEQKRIAKMRRNYAEDQAYSKQMKSAKDDLQYRLDETPTGSDFRGGRLWDIAKKEATHLYRMARGTSSYQKRGK